jgi:DNA-binding response OmpR family regulator
MAEIKVSDTGIGIPQEAISKIFEPFYQVDSSSTRFHEGTGIGLYHTKELVEILNGTISVSSVVNEGTEFVITLPMEHALDNNFNPIEEEESQSVKIDNENEIKGLIKKKGDQKPLLLIIEDSSDLRAYIKEEFEGMFQILEASNGKEGFLAAIENYPDIVISDIMMPEMDGLQFCKVLKADERTSHIPIILLTAKADEQNIIEGFDFGADDYITKPFNIKLLIAKVDSLLKVRRKLREKYSKEVFSEPEDVYFNAIDKRFLEKLTVIIEANIANSEFQVADLAFEIGMGKTNLYKKVITLTNLPVGDFIRTYRLKHAAKLLLTNQYSVTEVASMIGFNDTSHFIKSFSRQYNFTPKKFIDHNKTAKSD